jgi:centromeric protein E
MSIIRPATHVHTAPTRGRQESHRTLRFACHAKRVVNNAVVNEVLTDATVLKRQAKEIEELKRRLAGSG